MSSFGCSLSLAHSSSKVGIPPLCKDIVTLIPSTMPITEALDMTTPISINANMRNLYSKIAINHKVFTSNPSLAIKSDVSL